MSVVSVSTTADKVWAVGRPTIGTAVKVAGRMKVYGKERVPMTGGLVIACNHFHWVDPPALGYACPRTIYFMAKVEAHRVPGLGTFISAFGTSRCAAASPTATPCGRCARSCGTALALGLFAEGTRQRAGIPGALQPGAAMVALQEDVPVIPVAIHGSQTWKPAIQPISLAWGEPIHFEGLPKGGKGYKEASAMLQAKIKELFDFLVEMHALGRPDATPPR